MSANQKQSSDGEVLCEALFNASNLLGITQAKLGATIGLKRTSVTRVKSKNFIDPSSIQGQLSMFLIRIFRNLHALMGGDSNNIKLWMATENEHLRGVPEDLITQIQGLVAVTNYLDTLCEKN